MTEIRDLFKRNIQDAPVNLKYLTSSGDFILDWKKLKSTKHKMGVLKLNERDINTYLNSSDKPSKDVQYLMQLDYEKK